MSLLFGSTWVVNSAIFAGILFMVLCANLMVERFEFERAEPWFIGLFLSVVLLWAVNTGALNAFSLPMRGIVGGLLTGLPIGFAGIIVSITLSQSERPASSLGANLLGSVLGGCLEYFSMMIGLRALALLAFTLYLAALFFLLRQNRQT